MKEKCIAFARMVTVTVVSLGMIMIIAGVISEVSSVDVAISKKFNEPKVSFNDYKEFRNSHLNNQMSDDEIKENQIKFQDAFFKYSSTIFSNLSNYSTTLKQGKINQDRFEEYLFNYVLQYDVKTRIMYLEELASESTKLYSYLDEIEEDKQKTIIFWDDFFNWFSADFNYQLEESNEVQVHKNIFLTTDMLIIFILLLISIELIRLNSRTTTKEEACTEATETTPSNEDTQDVEVIEEEIPEEEKK